MDDMDEKISEILEKILIEEYPECGVTWENFIHKEEVIYGLVENCLSEFLCENACVDEHGNNIFYNLSGGKE